MELITKQLILPLSTISRNLEWNLFLNYNLESVFLMQTLKICRWEHLLIWKKIKYYQKNGWCLFSLDVHSARRKQQSNTSQTSSKFNYSYKNKTNKNYWNVSSMVDTLCLLLHILKEKRLMKECIKWSNRDLFSTGMYVQQDFKLNRDVCGLMF